MDISEQEAFKAMTLFLNRMFQRTGSDDIAALLGDIRLLPDGKTADPAAWQDWTECVALARDKPDGSR